MNKFEIDMPNDTEIKNEIDFIINSSFKPKVNFFSHIKYLFKEIGFKYILFNPIEIILALVITILYLVLVRSSLDTSYIFNKDILYSIVFMLSPIFYILINLFSLIKIKENNMYEVEMVCKYNTSQLISLRMLVFSFISIIFNSIIIVGLYNYIDVFRGMMISLTSLLLFSVISLYIFFNIKSIVSLYMPCILWITLSLIVFKLNYINYLNILTIIPNIVYILCIIISGYMYIMNIKRLIQNIISIEI